MAETGDIVMRSLRAAAAALVLSAGTIAAALAHHGWSWTADGDFRLTGVIADIYLGNPHAVLKVEAEDELWTVELAPPRQTAASGFVEGVAAKGDEIIALGKRSADPKELRMKAERLTLKGVNYDVYPGRVSN